MWRKLFSTLDIQNKVIQLKNAISFENLLQGKAYINIYVPKDSGRQTLVLEEA